MTAARNPNDINRRIESDELGRVSIPADRLYGAQTQRAVENFAVSGLRIPWRVIRALAHIKRAAAIANLHFERIDDRRAHAIIDAATAVADGLHDDQFPVDVYQTGSGTSTNMNVNEVIANIASEKMGGRIGEKKPVHPNDHVNLSQSSNDTFPTAVHVATMRAVDEVLLPALTRLINVLAERASDWSDVVAPGRTHLMDALPVRMGDVFSGYAAMLETARTRVIRSRNELAWVPLGATAVGTGYGAPIGFSDAVLVTLSQALGMELLPAANKFQSLSQPQPLLAVGSSLRLLALDLTKIANDIRWLGSGPRTGLAELKLPAVQPGSSMMPGKVNPVMCEMLLMACAQTVGLNAAIDWCGASGNFQLNTSLPLLAWNLDHGLGLLGRGMMLFAERCIRGLEVDREHCLMLAEASLASATALVPLVGHDRAAEIAQDALRTGESVRKAARGASLLTAAAENRALSPHRLSRKIR